METIGLCMVNPCLRFSRAIRRRPQESAKRWDDSFWVIDRIVYDNLEPLTVLAAAAAVTSKIRLGTSVLLAALRHPTLLAKTVATLDFLSAGRMTLGMGFGSRENDFTSIGIPYEHRGGRAEELVRLVRRLWAENSVTHKGKFYQVENVTIGPRPIQNPYPPIWMGGSAEAALKRARRAWRTGTSAAARRYPNSPRSGKKSPALPSRQGAIQAK